MITKMENIKYLLDTDNMKHFEDIPDIEAENWMVR